MTKVERNERKEWMLELFESGFTYKEIGEIAGISKQRVFQIIGKANGRRFRTITKEQCVFDGLRRYLNDNRISLVALTREMYGELNGSYYQIKDAFKSNKACLTMPKINRILSVTGLTYEQAFLSRED